MLLPSLFYIRNLCCVLIFESFVKVANIIISYVSRGGLAV